MNFKSKVRRVRSYPTLNERRLTRIIKDERVVAHGLYLQKQALLNVIRSVGEMLQIPNSTYPQGGGDE